MKVNILQSEIEGVAVSKGGNRKSLKLNKWGQGWHYWGCL